MPTSGSPAVRRRRLAAELRRLRGSRTGGEVSSGLGWSPSKISRYEQGRAALPQDEIEKLLDFYGVTDPERGQLLSLARESNERGWWEDYADALPDPYQTFIGLEAEAASVAHWQIGVVPGLLQVEEYARQLHLGYQSVDPITPGVVERRVRVRMIRQQLLTRDPPLELSAVIDESVLLRRIGDRQLMRTQLEHLVQASQLSNVELRVLPLSEGRSIMTDAFVIFSFGPIGQPGRLHDVVSTEGLSSEFYVEGESDTFIHRLVFQNLVEKSLSPAESRDLIQQTAEHV